MVDDSYVVDFIPFLSSTLYRTQLIFSEFQGIADLIGHIFWEVRLIDITSEAPCKSPIMQSNNQCDIL